MAGAAMSNGTRVIPPGILKTSGSTIDFLVPDLIGKWTFPGLSRSRSTKNCVHTELIAALQAHITQAQPRDSLAQRDVPILQLLKL